MTYQWFRLYHRIIDDEKVRLLAFEDRWHFVALCCLKCEGLLDDTDSDLKWRKVALKLGVQMRELDEIKRRLKEVELVDENMVPMAWDVLQYKSDTSTNRVRKHREKSKTSDVKRQRNVSVTPPDTDTDKEKRIFDPGKFRPGSRTPETLDAFQNAASTRFTVALQDAGLMDRWVMHASEADEAACVKAERFNRGTGILEARKRLATAQCGTEHRSAAK